MPDQKKEQLTDLSEDGAGQQTKVGRPYDGEGGVQKGVRDRMQQEKPVHPEKKDERPEE